VIKNAAEATGTETISIDLMERLRVFALRLEQCSDSELRSAYEAQRVAGTDRAGEALCFIDVCLEDARRRVLDISDWCGLIVSVPCGVNDDASADSETEDDSS
jgi:hypothetical protein